MRFDPEEHKRRKAATALDFTPRKNPKGEIINPAVISVAVQHKKDECDINRIVKRVLKNGAVDPSTYRPGRFGDFTSAVDFQEAQNRVIRMNNEFMTLSPEVRLKFENNPAKMVEFLYDPKNKEEAIKLGLLPKPVIKTTKVETPEGNFWVTTKDNVEIGREPVKVAAPANP